ncbi:MAG: energy transducer TonB [Calditrichaeota bacterium]|nr:MAG: energy transducer TonB [Calditrichota bacterium]
MRALKEFNPFGIELGKTKDTPEELAFWQNIKTSGLPRTKNPEIDIKKSYKKTIEMSYAISILFTIVCFLYLRNFATQSNIQIPDNITLEVEQIPVTKQFLRPPAPPRPAVPIASADEDIPDDETIDDTEVDFSDIPAPPDKPVVSDLEEIFVVYDTPPQPIGGFGEIYKYVVYPEVAIKAGLEGTVYLKCLINTKGEVERTEILKSSGTDIGFEEAAQLALAKVQWKPAQQRDRSVKVWVSVPVRFSLTQLKS